MLTLVHDGTDTGGLSLVHVRKNLEIERMAIVYFYAQNRMVGGGRIEKVLELLAAEEIVNNQ
jgi:hypothetical protein